MTIADSGAGRDFFYVCYVAFECHCGNQIDFCLINFAIFNVADCFVCVGAGFMALWVILDSIREEKARKAAEETAKTAGASEHE